VRLHKKVFYKFSLHQASPVQPCILEREGQGMVFLKMPYALLFVCPIKMKCFLFCFWKRRFGGADYNRIFAGQAA
jgi:hypothetical protein